MSKNRWLLIVGAVLLVALAGWFVTHRDKAVEYNTATIERGDITTSISASGKIQAVNTVEVGSQVSGQLVALYADYNTPVKKGQILARIDPGTFQARVEQSSAQAVQAQAQIRSASAALTEAQRDYDTKKRLLPNGFITKRTVQTAEAALAAARSNLASARGQLTVAQSQVAQNGLDVSRSIIRAPVNGTVIDRAVNLGQTVAASLQAPKLFVIAEDLSRMQVEAAVDEADIGRVEKGQRVEFTVDAYPDRNFQGTVTEIRLNGVETSNVVTYTVVIEAPNPDGKLLPGMTANANIILGEVKNVLKVPVAATRFRPASAKKADTSADAQGGSPLAGASGPPRGFGPGGGRPDPSAMVDRLDGELDLSADQKKAITTIMQQSFAQMGGGGGGGGGDRNARRAAREAMRTKIAALLTPEQRAKYEAMQPAGGGGRGGGGANRAAAATVYVLVDGNAEERQIRVRKGDDDYSAAVSGLKKGDKVITGEIIPDEDAK